MRQWRLGEVFVLRHAGFPFDWVERLGFSPSLLELAERVLDGDAARQELERAYRVELGALRELLHRTAADERVQDAVFFSNPAVYDNVWRRYLAAGERPDNADWRRVERVAYTYLQRLCAKNETTSFFGPMGYGEVVEGDGFEVRVEPGVQRRAFLAYWAAGELARAIARTPGLRPHLPVRANPAFRVAGGVARSEALEREVPLGAAGAGLLGAVAAGARTLAEAARALGVGTAEVMREAAPSLRGGALLAGPELPSDTPDTLRALCEAVASLPPGEARDTWSARLAALDKLLLRFAAATGADRRELLRTIEREFTAWTGVAARRGEGQVYADRLVLFEEASSPFRVRIGRRLAGGLARALSGGLELSAAYGERVQRDYREGMRQVIGDGERLSFMANARRARPEGGLGSRFAPLPVVGLPAGAAAGAVPPELCGEPGGGGRYALPDVCLAAPSPEAVGAGAYRVVLTRVHHHLLVWSWLSTFHPDPARFESVARSWLRRDPDGARLVSLETRRRNKGFYRFPGPRALMPGVTSADPAAADIQAADLEVEGGPDGPRLRDREGRRLYLYLPLADFPTYPPFGALSHPLVLHAPLRADGDRVPRLEVGGAVYQRARWERRLGHLASLRGAALLLAVARERREGGWPRFLFARVASERKPQLIDTCSPFGHELLRRLARGDEPVTLEEMLPGPDQLWLRDKHGRYTCELRLQAVRPAAEGSR